MSKSIKCFLQLICYEFFLFRKEFFRKFFDLCVATTTNAIVFGYLFPLIGMKSQYGAFIVVGAVALFGFFDIINRITIFIFDITGDKTISYKLTLPTSTTLVFLSFPIGWGLISSILTFLLFPLCKLILLEEFPLSNLNFLHFVLIFPTINLFFGFFALWLASLIKNIRNVSWLWFRVVNPLFMFGCYFYTWGLVYKASPIAGYINLLNPLIYAMEGLRASVLGPEQYLPFWICFFVLWICIFFCAIDGIHRLKKRLDCI